MMKAKGRLVVLTGAGISAESGLSTFRDQQGLWANHRIEDVATPEAWARNPSLVLDFYNKRRRQLADARPNAAHHYLKELEKDWNLTIVTQNVDDLHERAGSDHVLHLHGELTKCRSSGDERLVKEIGYEDIKLGERCPSGFQWRPHIVWFGEAVPAIIEAEKICQLADAMLIIGTSLQVYPAAGLVFALAENSLLAIVDPERVRTADQLNLNHIAKKAASAREEVLQWASSIKE